MGDFDRRDFLKLVGVSAGTAAATGCSELPEQLIPYVVQPEEITPGLPVIYASTCQECSAGCGLHVRTREGRPVKLEGNPEHPINRGKLCARGQASLSRSYHPDRYRGPLERGPEGEVSAVSWDAALSRLGTALGAARGKVAVLGPPVGPTLDALIDRWLEAVGGGQRVVYDPLASEALARASELVFGVANQPVFDLSGTEWVIDFGSDALSTGLSPVEHARQLAAARDASTESGRSARLVYVGPRLDETASQSDQWLPAAPGSEGILALGLARAALDAGAGGEASEAFGSLLARYDSGSVAAQTGVEAAEIRRLGAALAASGHAVALPPGVALSSRRATATHAAVLVLNAVIGAVGRHVKLYPAAGRQPSFRDLSRLVDAMRSGDVDVLIVHGANPVHTLPADAGFDEALARVGLVVSTASLPDETSERAHLVLPDHSPMESWGDAAPRPGVRSLVQPTLRPLFDTRALGDSLLDAGRAMGEAVAAQLPRASFRGLVEEAWQGTDWRTALQRGGVFASAESAVPGPSGGLARLEFKVPQLEGQGEFTLLAVPSPLLGDGSGANLPLLQETPDPITKIAWQSWAEISKGAAERLGVGPGDLLSVKTTYGELEVPVWPRGGIRDDVVAIAIGQGHTVGRYASLASDGALTGEARGVNVNALLPALTDESGGRAWLAARASLSATGGYQRLPFTQGTDNKRGRLLGERISLVALARGESPWAANESPGQAHGAPAGGHGEGHGEEAGAHGAAAAHGEEHHEGPPPPDAPRLRPGRRLHRGRPLPLGHDHRRGQVHGLQRLRGGLCRREQHPGGGRGRRAAQPADELAAHRALRGRRRADPAVRPPGPAEQRAAGQHRRPQLTHAVSAVRRGSLRAGVPGLRHLPHAVGPERHDLQPLHRHPLLRQQLPLQGPALQLVRLPDRELAGADGPGPEPGRHRARPGRDGEVHLLHPAHPGGPPGRQVPGTRGEGGGGPDRLPADLPHRRDHLRQPQAGGEHRPRRGREERGPQLPRPPRAQHAARGHLPGQARPIGGARRSRWKRGTLSDDAAAC